MENPDIVKRFGFYTAEPAKRERHHSVRNALKSTALYLDGFLPDGREKACVMTKLEEAMFWANAAIARDPDSIGSPSVITH